jgi:quercetin dioxygenase-like cupin family protein
MKGMRFFASLSLLLLAAAVQAAPSGGADYARGIKVTPLLRTTTTTSGQQIRYPKTSRPVVSTLLVEIPPGCETGWHIHPMPCYAYILSGSVTVEFENGKKATYREGQAFAETVNTLHNGRNNGRKTTKIVMTVTGAEGVPVSERIQAK